MRSAERHCEILGRHAGHASVRVTRPWVSWQQERRGAWLLSVSSTVWERLCALHRYGSGVLLVINGAPGVGKSTLGRLYSGVHPLSLVIDIDSIRMQLGRWEELDESRLIARDLAVALARAHLRSGHVVIVPQFIGRPEFVERLRLVAAESGVRFVEVVLTDDSDAVVGRFRLRRNELDAAGGEHPQSDLADAAIASEVARANDQLLLDAASRGAFVLSGSEGPEESCRSLQTLLVRATDEP